MSVSSISKFCYQKQETESFVTFGDELEGAIKWQQDRIYIKEDYLVINIEVICNTRISKRGRKESRLAW